MDEMQSADKIKEFENEGTKENNVEKVNTEETDSNCDERKGKCLSCGKCYVPKRYVTTAMTAMGMLLIYAMRTNLGVTVITILDHSPHTKVHENTVSDLPTVDWDTREVGFLHAVFYIGYIITHIPGGYLITIWQSHRIFGGCILFSAALNLLLPVFVEDVGYVGTCLIRSLQGMGEGLLYPACYGLLRHWSTTKERGRLVSAVLTGGACIFWYFTWLCFVYEKPSHHTTISDEEYKYLTDAQGDGVIDYVNLKIPWFQILTSLPVLSLCICHFARNWIFVFMLTNEPYYLNNFGFTVAESGTYSSIPHIVKVITAFGSGYIADCLLVRCSTTAVRKILTGIGFGMVSLCFLILTYCESGVVAILVLSIASGSFAISVSGWQINHYDLSTRYAGVLVSVTSAFGTLGAIAVPMVTGEFTKDRTLSGWDDIFYVTIALFVFAGLVFLIFGSGEEQPWANPPPNITLVQKIDPLARKPYKTFTQQKTLGIQEDLPPKSVDGAVEQKEQNISKIVERLTKQISSDHIKDS